MPVLEIPSSRQPSISLGCGTSARRISGKGICANLRGAWLPILEYQGSKVYDISGFGNNGNIISMPWGSSMYGSVITGTNNGTQRVELDRRLIIGANIPFTVWSFFYRIADDLVFFSQTSGETFGHLWIGNSTFVKTTATQETIIAVPDSNAWVQVAITRWENGDIGYWFDGVWVGQDAGCTGILNVDSLVNSMTGDYAVNGIWGASAIWDRVLHPSDIKALYDDPHLIARTTQQIVVGAGGANAPTGGLYGSLIGPLGGAI